MLFVLSRIPRSLSMRSQRTTVDHNEKPNKLSRTQSLPRTKAKPKPRTHRSGLDPKPGQKPRSLQRSKETITVSSHDRFAEAKYRVQDTVPPPIKPSGHSRWTDPERCWLGFREQPPESRLQAAEEKLQSELNTFDRSFLVTEANDIKKHITPELLGLQLEICPAKRPLVGSLGSVMGALVNMKRAPM